MNDEQLGDLAQQLEDLRGARGRSIAVAIDGMSGSGKTSLAFALEALISQSFVLQTDSYHVPLACAYRMRPRVGEVGAMIDWRRLRETALAPIRNNAPFDVVWINPFSERLEAVHHVAAETVVLCDGTFSARSELWDYYDFHILVRAPVERARRTREARDATYGPEWRSYIETVWAPDETSYLEGLDPARFYLVHDADRPQGG